MPRSPHPVATRAEVETVLRGGAPRPVPLFLPAIYEHKAWFIGRTPSAIARDADLLTRALLAEFEAEAPGILNWALAGLADYCAAGLRPPPCVAGAMSAFQKDSDVVGRWLEEETEPVDGHRELLSTLYKSFRAWLEEGIRF